MSRDDHPREDCVGHFVRDEVANIAAAKDRFVKPALILRRQRMTIGGTLPAGLAIV
jgi:hypothetical protein